MQHLFYYRNQTQILSKERKSLWKMTNFAEICPVVEFLYDAV